MIVNSIANPLIIAISFVFVTIYTVALLVEGNNTKRIAAVWLLYLMFLVVFGMHVYCNGIPI